ncbi:MAG: DUF4911 domain-containing protein [Desulfobacteraceae bacterium]|nr:DUF4911 domain-containing protein [Desulfobacteraceae bacterium]
METIKKYYRVDRRQISFMKFIFEAYDGVAVPTTLDAAKAIIVLSIAPGCESLVDEVVNDLKRNFLIEPRQSADID